MDDIAIVGVGLRFPGNATSPEELWKVLERGESQWSEFPKDRLNIDGYFHPSGDRQGSISFKGAHFLKSNVATFDAPFFSVAADDAKAIDPQQRILLEASYEALENAGIRKEDIEGSDTAVYVGSFVKDYEQICLRDPDWQPQYAATGNGIAIMANRISYAFNFHGPSMTIDTGCSGSLVAVHLAAQSLRNGESSLAIAAGAGMILTPNTIMPMTALNFLSPDGKCFTFDARANGYGRGEGIGVAVLKRLSDAIRDNDTIRAVIRGSRVNQDGRTTGITLPSKEAQVANIRSVYASAGLGFEQTGYVECHGTGTQAGDWRELKAISETLGSERELENPIVVGSVKPNIGHLEGAAGIAGLIKGVLVLERGQIPPNINFKSGNPDIDFENWRVSVPRNVMNWPLSGTRRVSVNCFGFGGTNAHVIMDEAPAYLASHKMKAHHNSLDNTPHVNGVASRDFFDPEYHLFCFSSNEKSGVKRVMDSHLQYIENAETTLPSDFLENYSYTLGCRRSNMGWKGAIVAKSTEQLTLKMKSIDQSSFTRSSRDKPPRIGFVFCGQGSQWAGMGKDLISFAAFRESLEAASYFMKIYLGSSFNLLEEMFRAEDESRISDADISQPATTALQVALVDLLSAFWIKPSHVVGHSSGEIAAAYASGAISRETAWEVAYFRGQTAASISVKAPKLKGGMVAAGMSLIEAEAYLESLQNPVQASVQVACINSPRSVTLSGQADAISFIADDLRQRGVFNRVLPVSTAYHSEHMKLVEHDYQNHLADIKCGNHRPGVTMFSSVTGSAVTGNELGASYWVANMLSPVQYVKAVQEMMGSSAAKRPNIIVELSPRPSLRTPTSDIVDGMSITTTLLSVLQRNVEGEMSLLQTVGDLWTQGCLINMKYAATRGEVKVPKCLVDLPPYPWNHSKLYWHESHLGEANRFRKYPRQDLIGAPTADSISFEPRWRGFLRVSENPWIQDHQVQKTIVYPAAGMISMVLEGAKQMTSTVSALLGYEICNMKIEKAMIVPSTAHGLEMALNIKEDMETLNGGQLLGSCEFAIYSKQLNGPWERNASGLLRFRYADGNWKAILEAQKATHDAASANCTETLVPRQLYELLDTVGMNYGYLFQNIVDIRKGGDSCVSRIRIPDTKSKMPAQFEYPHVLHPAALDSMFQTLFALEPLPMVPTFIESLFVSAELGDMGPDDYFTGCSTARRIGLGDAEADITMRLRESSSYIMIRGLHLTALGSSASEEGGFLPNHRNLCTNIAWSEDVTYAKPSSLVEFVRLWAHKYPGVSILDVGGVCSSTLATLDSLSPPEGETSRLFRYAIADLGDSCAALTLKHLADTPLAQIVESVKIDGSEPLPDFDLILMHLDCPIESDHLTKHLKAAGRLLRYSNIESTAVIESMSYPNIGQTRTQELPLEITILYPDFSRIEILGFANRVEERFVSQGLDNVVFSKLSLREAARDPSAMAGKVVFSLLDFGRDDEGGFFFQMEQENFELFHTIQRIAKGIFWVTQSANMDCQDPRNSPVIALARTLMSEDPLKIIVTLDLDLESVLDSEAVHSAIVYILSRTFIEASGSWPREMEYAARGGKLYIPRLTTIDPLNQLIENNGGGSTFETAFRTNRLENSPSTGLRLSITKPGLANDGMHFEEFDHEDLGPLDVEIAFERSDLSFKDLDTASGRTRDSTVGLDVFGHIVRKGSSVESLKTGSSVMALVSGGSFQSSVIADPRFVAATRPGFVPSSFLSAYYAIVHVGRAGPRRKVLVHAGASSYGLAAIQLCLIVGADVFATVIGNESDEQRARLERAGVPSDHIINGNSESFTHVVLNMTSGKGVDVVYNPTQEHVELNASCVRRCGTIVQFADRSMSPRVPRVNLANGTFTTFDLGLMMVEDADFVAELLQNVLELTQNQPLDFVLSAMPSTQFEVGKLQDAFKHIERAPYLNHASIVGVGEAPCSVPVLRKDTTKSLQSSIHPNGTYLLVGGLGGLGRSISELLVSNGATNLAFISRSGASSEQSKAFLKDLTERGVNTQVYCVDVCDLRLLQQLIHGPMAKDLPKVVGVFQCAAVIKDAVFDNMTYEDWVAATRPKILGSWNIVQAMDHLDPFFIFLASSAGVIGNRGQANYAAGNCFEDAIARSRRRRGKHAVSVDLGPVLGAGMLAEDEAILDMLRASGFYGIRHEDFLKVVTHAITMETLPGVPTPPQVTLGVGTGGLMLQNQPADPYWSRTALYSYLNLVDMPPPDLSLDSAASKMDMKAMLATCADTGSATDTVSTGLMHMLAKAMNMLFEEMDAGKPPNSYGVDSLVAVGVRNWVLSNTGVQVSVFEVLSDKTIAELAALVVEKGGFGAK